LLVSKLGQFCKTEKLAMPVQGFDVCLTVEAIGIG
jgi:hypothetical protein